MNQISDDEEMGQVIDSISMALVGDMYLRDEDASSLFALTGTHLTGADVTFGNLEAPISDRGVPMPGQNNVFRSEPSAVAALVAGRFAAVGLANNHSMDYGPDAILQTMQILDGVNIGHTGAGRNIAEAHEPAVVERKGTKIAFLSYASVFKPAFAAEESRPGIAVVKVATAYQTPYRVFEHPGAAPIILTIPDADDLETLRQDINRAKRLADIVVVSWHWGSTQGARALVPYQVQLGHAAIDAGADLVIGHHPHVLQGIETYKGKLICYSMGNFSFNWDYPGFSNETMILKCVVEDKRIRCASFVPALINDKRQPEALDLGKGRGIVDKLGQLSASFGTPFTLEGGEVLIGPVMNTG